MIRTGICDDESRAREALKIQLEQLLREEDAKVIYEFSSGEGLCAWLPKHAGELDLLFLDVEMGGMNGMETARRIRQSDNGLLIVFVTGYADFVFDGYSVQALDYVMKPVKRERLAQLMERVEEQLRRRSPQTLTIQNTEGLFRVAYEDILYCYSDRRQVTVVTQGREYPFYAKLDDVAQTLGSGFVRIHQRYLVRAKAVSSIQGSEVCVGPDRLPISRGLRQQAMAELTRSMLED